MKRITLFTVVALLPLTSFAAQPVPGFGAHVSYIHNDAGSGSNFDASGRAEVFGQLIVNRNIALEVGGSYSSQTEDSGADNQGTYKIDITSSDVFAGLRLDSPPMGAMNLYGRGGMLYYESVIDFREDFYGIKPGGSLEKTESGTGYYLEAGVAFRLAPNMKVDTGFTHRVRQDYFGRSSKPFDMTENGLSVGMIWQY